MNHIVDPKNERRKSARGPFVLARLTASAYSADAKREISKICWNKKTTMKTYYVCSFLNYEHCENVMLFV